MKTYINSDIETLTLTYLEQGEVITEVFNTEQELKNFMVEHSIALFVSNARNYNDLPDSEIVQQYEDLKTSLNI